MEITIGVQNVARELVLETELTSDAVVKQVIKALEMGGPLQLTDTRGRRVVVPAASLGYVEVGGDESRKVGFHTS